METWRAYKNHYWPHVYLIDAEGRIRFDHIGEGGEALIQVGSARCSRRTGARLPDPIDFEEGAFNPHITPEIYAGHLRGHRRARWPTRRVPAGSGRGLRADTGE